MTDTLQFWVLNKEGQPQYFESFVCSSWVWTSVSRATGEHFNHYAIRLVYLWRCKRKLSSVNQIMSNVHVTYVITKGRQTIFGFKNTPKRNTYKLTIKTFKINWNPIKIYRQYYKIIFHKKFVKTILHKIIWLIPVISVFFKFLGRVIFFKLKLHNFFGVCSRF